MSMRKRMPDERRHKNAIYIYLRFYIEGQKYGESNL